jgi:hypothetical protein
MSSNQEDREVEPPRRAPTQDERRLDQKMWDAISDALIAREVWALGDRGSRSVR